MSREGGAGVTITLSPAGHFVVVGELGFATAVAALKVSTPLIDSAPLQISVDLHAVTSADSAGVALLIDWWRRQRQRHGTIEFINVPLKVYEIAAATGIDSVLQLQLLPQPHLRAVMNSQNDNPEQGEADADGRD
ncbi:MAG: STAS domain-containing protein [Gammaproteobacteria bacterium]|nr:STAS domain-containing protein [Gammaproteobacteria bacterium]